MRSREWFKGAASGFAIAAIVGIGFGAIAHKRGGINAGVIVDGVGLTAELGAALDELARIEQINDRNRDRKARIKIHRGIHDLRADLEAIQQKIATAQPAFDDRDRGRWDDDDDDDFDDRDHDRDHDRIPPDRDHRGVSYSLTDAEIELLVVEIGKAMSSQARLQVVREAANGRWISTAQIIRLMNEMSFSVDRIELAAMLHGNCSDPQSFYLVYGHLPFEADRKALKKRLGQ